MQSSEAIHPERLGSYDQQSAGYWLEQMISTHHEKHTLCVSFQHDIQVKVRHLTESIVRLTVQAGSDTDSVPSPGITPLAAQPFTIEENQSSVVSRFGELAVTISNGSPASLSISDSQGVSRLRVDSIRFFADGSSQLRLASEAEADYFGLGEKTGWLSKQGSKTVMWNSDVYAPHNLETEALYVSIPYLLKLDAKGATGFLLDAPAKSEWNLQKSHQEITITLDTGAVDFYVILGQDAKQVTERYTELSGRMPLPPAWSLGYHQSRYSYMSQQEVEQLAEEFRSREIPCDAIHLDIHYMRGYRVFTFDANRFPNPKKMVGNLLEQGFHIVPIVDPGVKRDVEYTVYQEGVSGNYFCRRLEGELYFGEVWPGISAFPDFTSSATRSWWGEKHKFYTQLGIQGIWNDMNEPAVFNESKTMELDVMHQAEGRPQPHRALHNLYGLQMSRATYEGLREQLQGERPFVLTRSGYIGVQRYAAVWTGDNRSFWEHMEMAVPMLLNMGLSGIPFAGVDVGGFAYDTQPELLARWTQLGAFLPFFRNHSAIDAIRQEPWRFGEEIEAVCRAAIARRYRLIPYLYSVFAEAARKGWPVVRPIFMEAPGDSTALTVADEFFVGRHLLAAPVLRPQQRKRMVYFPEGEWVDVESGLTYSGAQYHIVDAPLSHMPLFARAGAPIAETDVYSHLQFEHQDVLRIVFYGHPVGETAETLDLYEDDGHSFAYEQKNAYNLVRIQSKRRGNEWIVTLDLVHEGYSTPYTYRELRFTGAAKCWQIDTDYRQDGDDIIVQLPVGQTSRLILRPM